MTNVNNPAGSETSAKELMHTAYGWPLTERHSAGWHPMLMGLKVKKLKVVFFIIPKLKGCREKPIKLWHIYTLRWLKILNMYFV